MPDDDRKATTSASSPPPGVTDTPDVVDLLLGILRETEPHFVLIVGAVGTGKSTLLRTLVRGVAGPKLLVAYQSSSSAPALGSGAPPPVPMLLVDPQFAGPPEVAESPPPGRDRSLLAFSPGGPTTETGISGPLAEAVARLSGQGTPTVLVDSWDRGSESFFRSFATRPDMARVYHAPPGELAALRSSIVSTPIQLVLGVLPENGTDLLSLADVVVALEEAERPTGRLRLCRILKARGRGSPGRSALYTVDGERFRSLPPLSARFRPGIGPADPDPEPTAATGWPGSSAFAGAFGRLRFGGMTGVVVPPECPDTIPLALVGPLVVHALRHGGRAVWMPSPEVRPTHLVALLRPHVPEEWLKERLRILTAAGDDPGLGTLRSIVLSLSRGVAEGREVRSAIASGTGPLFPDAFRFLREHPPETTAVYVASLEGLRAATAAADVVLEPATLPAVAGYYTRIPRYHLFCHGGISDPVTNQMMPMADTVLRVEMVEGRPLLVGTRPSRSPFALDWTGENAAYTLAPVS